jgi:plasmid stabilization system protein ParE
MEREAKELVFTPELLEQENRQFDYLHSEFGLKTANRFKQSVTQTIEKVANYPQLGRQSYLRKEVRIVHVNAKNNLIYTPEISRVVIVTMYQSVQDKNY